MDIKPQQEDKYGMAETKVLNFRPIAFCAAFLCMGIFLAYACLKYQLPTWWAFVGVPLVGVPIFLCFKKKQRYQAVMGIILCIAFFLGFTAFFNQIRSFQNVGTYKNTPCKVLGTIEEKYMRTQFFAVILSDVFVDEKQENGKLIAYLPATYAEILEVGEELLLQGKVTTATETFTDYGLNAYTIGDNVRLRMWAESCVVTGRRFLPFAYVRERIKAVVCEGMDETPAAVTIAVLLGDTDLIDEGLLDSVRRGGIAHVFAVSGLHVGALFAFVLMLIRKTALAKSPKWLRFLLMGCVLVFYGGVCGFSASVVRALVMCLYGYAAQLIGLNKDFLDTLGGGAILVLTLSPVALFEAGFQLSFAACLGIALLTKRLEKGYEHVFEKMTVLFTGKRPQPALPKCADMHPLTIPQRMRRACVSFLAMSTAAQLATTPLNLALFGYVSVWSMLLNCLFVPLITAAFSLLLVFVLLASVLPIFVGGIVLYLPSIFWSVLLISFQTLDFSKLAITGFAVNGVALACYYVALAFISDKINVKKSTRLLLSAVCFAAFVVIVCVHTARV